MHTPPRSALLPVLYFVLICIANGQDANVVERLGSLINTSSDELAAFRYADKFYFLGMRPSGVTGKKSYRALSAVGKEKPVLLDNNPKESSKHITHLSFNIKADRMYYTLCRGTTMEVLTDCEIWCRERNYEGGWGPASPLPELVNMRGKTTMHAAFGYDRQLGNEVLYFVSNRPGGKGGLDIWASDIVPGFGQKDDQYGEPRNLSINTAGDEFSPFFDTQTQAFFFSTNGRPCYGGFDIFRTKKADDGTWVLPLNLKAPINSEANECFFSLHQASRQAYFSSDRPTMDCAEKSCRNFDIYQMDTQAELLLSIVDASGKSPLHGCHVELLDAKTERIEQTLLNWPEAWANFEIAIGKAYTVIVSKLGYEPVFLDVTATPGEVFSLMTKTVQLKPMWDSVEKKPDGN